MENQLPAPQNRSSSDSSFLKLTLIASASTILTFAGVGLFDLIVGFSAGPKITAALKLAIKPAIVGKIQRLESMSPRNRQELHSILQLAAKNSAEYVKDLKPIILSIEQEVLPGTRRKSPE